MAFEIEVANPCRKSGETEGLWPATRI